MVHAHNFPATIFKSHSLLSEIALQVADLLEGGGGTFQALTGGGAGDAFFMIKQKIRDKMRYSNLSNNMMISKL